MAKIEEKYGIVHRAFYPPEISNERCGVDINNEIPRPVEVLEPAIEETKEARAKVKAGDAVLDWRKDDLRIHDNRVFSLATKGEENKVALTCLFIVSPYMVTKGKRKGMPEFLAFASIWALNILSVNTKSTSFEGRRN